MACLTQSTADHDYYTIAYIITKGCKSHLQHKGDGQTMLV